MGESTKAICDLLAGQNVAYELVEHEAVFTMEEMNALGLPHTDEVAKNLFVRDHKKRNYFILTVRGDKKVDLKALNAAAGSKPLGFASEEDLWSMLGLRSGSITPLGALNDRQQRVQVRIDEAFRGGRVGVHPNENTATVWLAAEDLLKVIRAHGNAAEFMKME